MDFREKHVLALGRYGLVGQAIARRLVKERPRRITLLSLGQEEAQDVVATLAAEALGVETRDTSSRFLRDRQSWGEEGVIQPGKVVGWIFATEEKGARVK